MVESAVEFRKNGFNDEDAAQLALVANMYQNVSDEAISAGDSASFIIAQMVAFGIEAENAEHIIDAVNETANNFAVSSGQLANSLGIVSSTASAMGNSMEETLGMMTAITEQTRNSTKAARGLNSIFNNLAQVLDDASSNGKKITAIFDSLNISMYDNEGQLLSSYELLSKLAGQWNALDTNTKNYIASTIAGTNQLNNFLALMNNFDHAVEATETALNSAGSAARENSRYMESLEAKTQQLKATFQDLANNVIDSELVKSILDLANNALNLLNTEVGQTITQWALLAGTLTGAVAIFGTIGGKLVTSVVKFASLIKTATSLTSVVGSLASSFGVATTGGATLTATLGSLFSVAFPIAGILAAIGVAGYTIYQAYKEANPTLEEATENIENLNLQLEDNQSRLEEINAIPWNERTNEILEEKAALEAENEELRKNLELQEQARTKAAQREAGLPVEVETGAKKYQLQFEGSTYSPEYYESEEEALDALAAQLSVSREELEEWGYTAVEVNEKVQVSGEEAYSALATNAAKYVAQMRTNHEVNEDELQDYNDLKAAMKEKVDAINILVASGDELTYGQKLLLEAYDQLISTEQSVVEWTEKYGDATQLTAQDVELIKSKFPGLIDQLEETSEGWVLLSSTVANTADAMISEDGRIILSAKNRAKEDIAALEQEIEVRSAYLKALMSTPYSSTDPDAEFKSKQIASAQQQLQELLNVQNALFWVQKKTAEEGYYDDSLKSIASSAESASSSTKKLTDTALESFKLYYQDLQHLRDMDEIDEEEYLNRLRKLVDDYTADATANMEKYGTNTETIARNMYQYEEELVDGWKQLQDERVEAAKEAQQQIIDALEEEQSIYEKFFSYMTDRIQEEIDDLQDEYDKVSDYWDEQIDALKAQNDELEKQIDLEEKLEALARAKQSKVLVYKDGRFQYIEDVEEINEAQVALEEHEREQALEQEVSNLEELKKQALDSIQQQIDAWEKYKEEWSSVVDNYQKEQDRLLIEQQLGIELEGENWKTRLDNLSSYVEQYKALMQEITNAQNQLNQIEQGNLSGVLPGQVGDFTSSQLENILTGNKGHAYFDPNKDYLQEAIDLAKAGDSIGAFDALTRRGAKVYITGDDKGTSQQEAFDLINSILGRGSSSSSGGSSSSSGNYGGYGNRDDFNDAIQDAFDKAQSSGDKVYIGDSGLYIDPNKVKKNAKGTTNFSGGLSLVGEEGPELRVLNQGDGIIPNGLTKNLIAMAQQYGSKDFTSNQESITSNKYQYSFDKLVLPNVTDFNSFLKEIKRFRRFAFQQ